MLELLWFLIGSAATLAITLAVVRGQRRRNDARAQQKLTEVTRRAGENRPEIRRFVIGETQSIGHELGNLASGVEGHAQLLCEALGDPTSVPTRAEQLWSAVRRVRFFTEKILSFVHMGPLRLTATDVRALLIGLRQELEDHSGGSLEVHLSCADSLQLALADRSALRSAILFLVETVLTLEPDASILELHANTSFAEGEDSLQHVEIELQAQCEDTARPHPYTSEAIQIGYIAARNLIEAQQGTLAFEHTPGLNATASITLGATISMPEIDSLATVPVAPDHAFGGVMILENDPSIRAFLGQEIARHGRNIMSIGDGAAARALFERTPERFELLVLAQNARRGPAEQLAAQALAHNETVKVLFLAQHEGALDALPEPLRRRCATVTKPFGVLEVREALALILGTVAIARS